MHPRYVAALSVAVLIAFAAWWSAPLIVLQLWGPQDEASELYVHQRHGSVTEGAKLGVAIGTDWREADRILRRQFRPQYLLWHLGTMEDYQNGRGHTVDDPVLTGDALVAYRDGTWRNGVVWLELHDGRVTRIDWHYSGPFHFDL